MGVGQDDKRKYRKMKRTLKQAGNQKVRRQVKDQLRDDPNNAHLNDEPGYGHCETKYMNGMDQGKEDFGERK
jgi:hypothetical protein